MRLVAHCRNCIEDIEFNQQVNDRGELSFEIGNKIELSCEKCFSKRYYHPNSIFAKIRKTVVIIALLISISSMIIISIFFWKFYNENINYIDNNLGLGLIKKIISITVIPLIFFGLIINNENMKVKRFNSYRIKD